MEIASKNGHTFSQIPGLIRIQASLDRELVGQNLHGYSLDDGIEIAALRYFYPIIEDIVAHDRDAYHNATPGLDLLGIG